MENKNLFFFFQKGEKFQFSFEKKMLPVLLCRRDDDDDDDNRHHLSLSFPRLDFNTLNIKFDV